MLTKLKPYQLVLIHEDQVKDYGIPTEVIEYTWTREGAYRIQKEIYDRMEKPRKKWVAVLPANWYWWWNLDAGSVYRVHFDNDEDCTMHTYKIAWWRKERLWRALWRLIRGKHKSGSHRAPKSTD